MSETPDENEIAEPLSDDPGRERPNTWIPDGRSIGEELRRPRYLLLATVALVVILLQIWVLF